MSRKYLPFSRSDLDDIIRVHPTPFHIYVEKGIRENARRLIKAFSWAPCFKNFFAVKAAPNPFLMKILASEGFGADCSSMPELLLAERCGVTGENIMFTSNDTPASEFLMASELGAIINLDDITHIDFLEKAVGLPELVSCRFNPGKLKEGNVIIGKPEEAKYGFTREQISEGFRILRDKGVKRFGLHAMVASNELDWRYFVETADILFSLAAEIAKNLGIRFDFVNLGGGIGIPYRSEQEPFDIESLANGIREKYESIIVKNNLAPVKIFLECGRMVTGPFGFLVSRVLHVKDTYKKYAGLDASMANLMRPALYGAYHHITVAGKENISESMVYDVTGSLCENNDKFAIDRRLPPIVPGDIVVIHDAGAHGHAMGFNYNGKLRSAELLLRESGEIVIIRRAETITDYFATLDFKKLEEFDV